MSSNKERKDLVTFERKIDVKRDPQTVWDTILTPRTWVLCFPATVNVGGDAIWEPFKPGNIVIEKFMWGGFMYAVFRYKIGLYKPPAESNPAVFGFVGTQVFTNTFVDLFFREDIKKIVGEIQYTLTEKEIEGEVGTTWERRSFYYHTGGLKTKLFFKTFMFIMRRSLNLQMDVYMATAKELMEKGFQAHPDHAFPEAVPSGPISVRHWAPPKSGEMATGALADGR